MQYHFQKRPINSQIIGLLPSWNRFAGGLLIILLLYSPLLAQSSIAPLRPQNQPLPKDIHTHSQYDKRGERLRFKYQYYFDFWSRQQVKHGIYTHWDQQGRPRVEMEYVDGLLIHKIVKNSSGHIHKEEYWEDQLKHGLQRWFFSRSRVKKEVPFEYGKKEGLAKWYYRNGQVRKARIFTDDKAQGKAQKFQKNGHLKQKVFRKS